VSYAKTQKLNEWVGMLHQVFGYTQNYAKTPYEVFTHLTEVCGAFGKYMFKRCQPTEAADFLPKLFAWGVALLKRVKGDEADLERIILTKYPRVCPYCCKAPCSCWQQNKPPLSETTVRDAYFKNAPAQSRSLNDFQLMFREIYEASWALPERPFKTAVAKETIRTIYTRMVEELSELAEAIRFYHLYPSNFDNEIADFFAWWFALLSTIHIVMEPPIEMLLAEDVLWRAYPASCPICELPQCDCRAGPVREILSKPSLTNVAFIDGLTQAGNRASYDRDVSEIQQEKYALALPIACIRLDIDDFKSINDSFSHAFGDEALKRVINSVRQKVRARDRLYRVGGDEFAVLCPDLSAPEARGMLERVQSLLKNKPLVFKQAGEDEKLRPITLSVGISSCCDPKRLGVAFEEADKAAIASKRAGKDRITVFGNA
jgi:diguanylate cyclase (GGDEF)-like protein